MINTKKFTVEWTRRKFRARSHHGFVGMMVFFLLYGAPTVVWAFSWDDLWSRSDQRAAELYERGDMKGAAQKFKDHQWRAAAWYKAKEYDRVLSTLSDDDSVQARYNKGNALAKSGRLEEAVAAYDEVLSEEPDHEDARFNRDLVKKILEQPPSGEPGEGGEPSDGEGEEGQEQGEAQEGSTGEDTAQSSDATGAGEEGEEQEGTSMTEGEQGEEGQEGEEGEQGMAAGDSSESEEGDESENKAGQSGDDEQQEKEENTGIADQGEEGADDDALPDRVRLSDKQRQEAEKRMAADLWLRNINATDGIFLRRKFQHQHQAKQRK